VHDPSNSITIKDPNPNLTVEKQMFDKNCHKSDIKQNK